MKCISCEVEINPKWKHAVEINVCPFCGQHILEEHLKNLLTSLAETMAKLQSYPEQVNDWLLSNYNYIKTDSLDLPNYLPRELLKQLKKEEDERDFQERKKFTVKVKTEQGEEDIEAETLQSEDKTSEFFKRAEVIKSGPNGKQFKSNNQANSKAPKEFRNTAEKTKYLKSLKEQIEENGSEGIVNEDGLVAMITPSQLDEADPEMVAGFSSLIKTGDIVSSSMSSSVDDEDSMTNQILNANMAIAGHKGKGGGHNAADMQALHDMYARVNESRKKMESGEAREEKKGGFSRRS